MINAHLQLLAGALFFQLDVWSRALVSSWESTFSMCQQRLVHGPHSKISCKGAEFCVYACVSFSSCV